MNRKKIAMLLCLSAMLLLAACGAQKETEAETGESTETAEEAVIPNTAAEAPALTFDALPNPGNSIKYTDSDGKTVLYILAHDNGADGNTPTYNKFDADGNLIWWCSYEYNELGQRIRGTTRDPEGAVLEWDEYTYDENGGSKTWTHFDAEGTLQYEYDYYENGNFSLYTSYMDGKTVMEYNEEGEVIYTASYDEDGNLLFEERTAEENAEEQP